MTGAISLSMTYGLDVLPTNDPNLNIARLAAQTTNEVLMVGSSTVDMLPMMRYLPSWFPGAGFQKVAAKARVHTSMLRDGIFEDGYKKLVRSLSLNAPPTAVG
jgi:hypothetical protein